MTRRKWRFSIAGLLVLSALATGIWYSRLTPYERCWTDKSREQQRMADLDAVEAAYAPRIAQTERQIDEANQQYQQSTQRIQEIDRAMATLECQKKGKVC